MSVSATDALQAYIQFPFRKTILRINTTQKSEISLDAIPGKQGECIIYGKKPKMSSAKKHRICKIHFKYDFIGFIPVKSLMRYAEESEQAQGKEISA